MVLAWDVSMETLDDRMGQAKNLLASAAKVLVVTGAGISAESGVPTFRGPGGYWRNKHFSELATPEAFARDPRLVWEWYCERRRTVAACEPNAAHRALAAWTAHRKGVTLVTQNVDDLHERAGHEDVIHLHGSLWKNRCTACDEEREERSLGYAELPYSPCCHAIERPAIVWFGESVPRNDFLTAAVYSDFADAALVIGTSGAVQTATFFVDRIRARRRPVIDVNPERSHVHSSLWIQSPAALALPSLFT